MSKKKNRKEKKKTRYISVILLYFITIKIKNQMVCDEGGLWRCVTVEPDGNPLP